jgi:hypothetical protein
MHPKRRPRSTTTMSQMNRAYLKHVVASEADAILNRLTSSQHLQPHRALEDVLRQTIEELGCCPVAVERAMQWLQLEGSQPIGRLRRTELTQLARAIFRFWRQSNLSTATANK